MSELLDPTLADPLIEGAPRDGFSELLARARREPRLGAEEERRLARLAADGDRAARDRLINAHIRLVVHLARQLPHSPAELPDLVQDGLVGLIRAVDRFDWRRGNRLSTYAVYWIRQSLLRSRRHLISVSAYQRERTHAVRSATQALEAELGRAPTAAELAIATGLTEQAVARSLQGLPVAVSIDGAAGTGSPLAELADHADPGAEAEARERREALERAVTSLPERLHTVLTLRYGLEGQQAHSPAEAGARLGLTRQQTTRLEAAGLERLFQHTALREAVGWLPRRLRSLFPFGLASPWAAFKGAVSAGTGAKAVAATVVVAGVTSIGAWQDLGPFGDSGSQRPKDPSEAVAAALPIGEAQTRLVPAHDRPVPPPASRDQPEARTAAPSPKPASEPDARQASEPANAGEPASASSSTGAERPSEVGDQVRSRPEPRSGSQQGDRSQGAPDEPSSPLQAAVDGATDAVGDAVASLPLPAPVQDLASETADAATDALDRPPALPEQLLPPADVPSEPGQTLDPAVQSVTDLAGP